MLTTPLWFLLCCPERFNLFELLTKQIAVLTCFVRITIEFDLAWKTKLFHFVKFKGNQTGVRWIPTITGELNVIATINRNKYSGDPIFQQPITQTSIQITAFLDYFLCNGIAIYVLFKTWYRYTIFVYNSCYDVFFCPWRVVFLHLSSIGIDNDGPKRDSNLGLSRLQGY